MLDQGLDDLGVDLIANIGLTLECDHIAEARTRWNRNRWLKHLSVAVFIGDILDEEHEEDVVLVLAGIHAPAQLVAGRPQGGVKFRFFNGHGSLWCFKCFGSSIWTIASI